MKQTYSHINPSLRETDFFKGLAEPLKHDGRTSIAIAPPDL